MLALRSGVKYEDWRDCDDSRVIPTAMALIAEDSETDRDDGDDEV